jgi:CheY-like chemotaxis protein
MSILVIEDSRFLRAAIERSLTKAGYSVTTTANGKEGIHLARRHTPAMILLDMMLPGIDGMGVLRILKQDPATKKIPVVVLSALSQRNEATMKRAGAAAYIEKSALNLECNASELIRIVQTVVMRQGTSASKCGDSTELAAQPQEQADGAMGDVRQ